VIYVDSIILFVTAIGVSLTIVLLFGATVLSINWWKYGVTGRHSTNKENENEHSQRIRDLEARSVIRSKPRTKKINQLSNWNELVNKKVNTCDKIYIGRIIAIDGRSVTIRSDSRREYAVSTYWIREYDEEKAVIDTSIRYLDYYQVEIANANSSIKTEERNEMKLTFKQPHFLLCSSCFWCASDLNLRGIVERCPSCMNGKVESMPISNNEIYTFRHNVTPRIALH
jgi:hypothetical protein